MSPVFLVFAILINGVSLFWLYLVRRDDRNFARSQMAVLGAENIRSVRTFVLRIEQILYTCVMVAFAVFTVFHFFFR